MTNDTRSSVRTENALNDDCISELHNMDKSIRRIELHAMGEPPPNGLPSGIVKFSVSSKGLSNQKSVAMQPSPSSQKTAPLGLLQTRKVIRGITWS